MRKYTITIDKNILFQYYEYYFAKYPKRKKLPIDSPIHPSINKWCIMPRPQMNDLKQRWKEFALWIVEHYGYSNLQLDNVCVEMELYFPTKARHDSDNYSPKFLFDGLVESGMIVDDDFKHIKTLTIRGDYDKSNPRMEIFIKEMGDETC